MYHHEPTCHLDFETYCEIDVRVVGSYAYARHPSCEVLILAYRLPSAPKKKVWLPHIDGEIPDDLREYADGDGTFTAHNAEFEMNIWEHVVRKKHDKNAPAIKLTRWRCSAAMAAACGLPRSLGNAGAALRLQIQKDKEGTRLINIFCKPRKPTKNNPATRIYPWDKPVEFNSFIGYCKQDVDAEEQVVESVPSLSKSEWRAYHHTCTMNARGLPLDMVSVQKGYGILQELEARVVKQVEKITGGIRPTQRDKMLAFFNGLGLDMADTQAKTIKDLVTLRGHELEPETRHLLMLRIEGGKASTRKLKTMLAVACSDGRVRGAFLFNGAHTGRLAGRLIQPQNFTRGEYKPAELYALFEMLNRGDVEELEIIYEWPIDALAQGMRGYIKAEDGKKFVVCDFAAIEARVLAWLAREERVIALYHKNADLYWLLAIKLYKLPADAKKDADPSYVGMRKFAKDLFLGSGYQLGAEGFVMNCLKRGIVVDLDEAKTAIRTYRDDNPAIVKLWADVEECAIRAVMSGASYTKPVQLRNLAFFVEGIFFCIELPSGRILRYPYPQVQDAVRFNRKVKKLTYRAEYKGKWVREGTYGGKLVENIVQAISRDIMVFSCFNAEERGYPVIGTVHDELITEVPQGFGSPHELEEILRIKPKWATDAPINAEGWEGVRYRK